MGFDLAAVLAGAVSELDTPGREQIEYIDIDRIDDDPNNFYQLSGLEALAENIELLGLQQPLRVRPGEDGHVIIVSGHRRKAALQMLADAGNPRFRQVPCIRERDDVSDAMRELRLIYANSDTRKMTPAEVSRQAERVEMLLYQLKEEGYDFPGRMRDHVAQACKVSAPKLARLKVIRENLSCEFMPDFESGDLPEQSAYALARMPVELQSRIARITRGKDLRGARLESVLRMYDAGARWDPEMQCPDGARCTHGDAALRHDLETYDACGGTVCCLTCQQSTRGWSPCERMCSKAKAQRKAARAQQEEAEELTRQKRTKAYQTRTQQNARRLLRAIDAAGVPDDTVLLLEPGGISVTAIRSYAAGEFPPGAWYGDRLSPAKIFSPVSVARILGCSTDFLFGLTEDPNPAESSAPLRFVPGQETPPHDGLYYCLFELDGLVIDDKAWWDGMTGTWRFRKNEAAWDAVCIGWYPLPEIDRGDSI